MSIGEHQPQLAKPKIDPEEILREMSRIEQNDDRGTYPTLPDQMRVPDHYTEVSGEQPRVLAETTFDPEKRLKNIKRIGGVTAAALTLAIGVGFGVARSQSDEEPRPKPTASAGVAPGETVAPTPTESAPALEYSPHDPNKWTTESVPLFFEGKEFTGVDAFKDAISVKVTDYPSAAEGAEALIERANAWVNYGNSEEARTRYKDYVSADLQGYSVRGVSDTFANKTFQEALATSDNGFTRMLQEMHSDNIIGWQPGDEKAKFKIEKMVNSNPLDVFLIYSSPKLEKDDRLLLHATLVEENGAWKFMLAEFENANK